MEKIDSWRGRSGAADLRGQRFHTVPLEVYDRLSVADANDYEKLKDALLKNFDMTERGFRKKFRNDRPERSETFIQFGSRL